MKTTLKTCIAIFCMVAFSVTVNAQSPAAAASQSPSKSSSMEDWKELKEFHKVMAQTFHPTEEGNYKPIRERSEELFTKARVLAESKIPAEFNKPEMLQAMQELVAGSRNLNAMITNTKATDQEISKSLTALHDTFHKIVGLCQPGDEQHHDHSDPNHKH